jgi:hypothetical protein
MISINSLLIPSVPDITVIQLFIKIMHSIHETPFSYFFLNTTNSCYIGSEATQVERYGPYIWRRNTDRNIIKIDLYTAVLLQCTAPYYGAQKRYRT